MSQKRMRLLLNILNFLLLLALLAACTPESETAVTLTPPPATTTTLSTATAVQATSAAQATNTPPATAVPPTATEQVTAVPSTPWVVTVSPDQTAERLPVKTEMNFTVVAQLGGRVNAVALDGNIAYVGIGPRLVTVDISDPTTPRFLGQSDMLPELVNAVVAQDGIAYVAGADLYIYDVSDPTAPVIISKLSDFGEFNFCYIADIALAHNTLYILDRCPNLRAIDVSNPKQLIVLDQSRSWGGNGITLIHNTLAVAEESGQLRLVDSAVLDQTLGYFQLWLPPFIWEVAATDALLFGVTGGGWLDCRMYPLHIIDITDAAVPQRVADFDPQSCIDDLAAAGNILLAATRSGVQIYDTSDPANLVLVSKFVHSVGFNDVQKIALNQDLAYIFSAEGGNAHVRVLDMAQPDVPVVTGTALDLSSELSKDGLDFTSQFAASWASGLDVQGDKLFLRISTYQDPPHDVVAIDISQPANPLLLGRYGWASEVLVGSALYAPVDRGVVLFDATDPANPALIDTIAIGNVSAYGRNSVFTVDSYLIISGGMTFYNVSDPLKPMEIGRLQSLPGILAVLDDTIYAAAYELFTIDISDLTRPPEIGRFGPLPGQLDGVTEIVPAGDVIYMRGGIAGEGIWVLNVSDRDQPYLAGHFQHPYFGDFPLSFNYNMAVKDDLLYLPVGDYGLLIVQVEK
jgi:hypothetical protein